MKKTKISNLIGLVHIGKREKSGLQILEKLKQHDFTVTQWDVLERQDTLDGIDEVKIIVVNIGIVNFDYDELLAFLFEKNAKIIINEAALSNMLTGVKRQSWERHLLNKIDSSYSVMPTNEGMATTSKIVVDFKEFGIKEVWVLAASIGGPEAIGKFLLEFNKNENFLFIIIQHIDKEFLPMMAQQFSQNSQLNVEIPLSGMKIAPSTCIIHPTDEHLKFDNKGTVELIAMNEVYAYSPCIDEACVKLVNNIADLNIAVFSGMSSDGIKAAKIIKEKGGKVITQNESSCVLSTIVEGIKKQINVDFDGAPTEMAKYILDRSII